MARRWLLAALVVALAVPGGSVFAASHVPVLRSAKAKARHVVIRVVVSDLRPADLLVATNPAEDTAGALLSTNIRLRETIKLGASASGVVRWRSTKRLPPGSYYVQVLAIDTGGVTDCPPQLRNCLLHWSNVRRVVVR